MPHMIRRGRPSTAPGLTLEQHEDLSRVLSVMGQQARGLRGLLRQATGGRSRPSLAAVAMVEAVGHMQEVLLETLDADYGAEAPGMVRVRYRSTGG